MGTKYQTNSGTTIGDRLLNVGAAARHLSDGSLVFLTYGPSNADIELYYASGARSSATLMANASGSNFAIGGLPQSLAMCRDAADNLYVVGQDAAHSNQIGVQCFAKKSGVVQWTPKKYMSAYYAGFKLNALVDSNFSGFAVTWCNTGGGPLKAGHLLVLANEYTLGRNWAFVINAGTALSGDITKGIIGSPLQPPNPAFMGPGGANLTDGSNLDLQPDGFGVPYGLSVAGNDPAHCTVGSWGVTSQGTITSGPGMATLQLSCGTLARTTTKLRVVRVAAGLWAVLMPSATHAGQLTVAVFGTTGLVGQVDTGTASNFPSPSASLSWGASADASGTLWVYGWSTVTHTTMLRLPVTVSSGAAPTLGTVVTDDTGVGSGTPTTIRVVAQPVDALHTDWQAYNTVSPYSLLGDWSALTSPPNQPTLVSPADGSVAALATGGILSWTFNPRDPADTQSGFYGPRRRTQPSGALEYWNAGTSAFQSSEVLNTSIVQSVTFGTGKWTADTTYNWSVDTVGATGLRSGYATDATLLVATSPIPTTPTLTATYDSANNRVTLVISGTGTRTATVQRSADGGTTWQTVRTTPVALVSGAATVYDYEAPPAVALQYRAFQQDLTDTYGAPSAFSSIATATPAIGAFWLRDPLALSGGISPHVKRGTFNSSVGESLTAHRPLGSEYAVVVADVIEGEDGQATFFTTSSAEESAFRALVFAQKTLLLQSPDNRQWYLRITSPRPTTPIALVRAGTPREHAVTWVEVQAP